MAAASARSSLRPSARAIVRAALVLVPLALLLGGCPCFVSGGPADTSEIAEIWDPAAGGRLASRAFDGAWSGDLVLATGGLASSGSYVVITAPALAAAAEAAMIGGLADWFAVTALFRHPLGLSVVICVIKPDDRSDT